MSHQTKGSDYIALLSSPHALGHRHDVRAYYNLINGAFEEQYDVYNTVSTSMVG
jgi:hypothetical protein